MTDKQCVAIMAAILYACGDIPFTQCGQQAMEIWRGIGR